MKEVSAASKEEQLNSVNDFKNLFTGVKLDADEREKMRELTELAEKGQGDSQTAKLIMR